VEAGGINKETIARLSIIESDDADIRQIYLARVGERDGNDVVPLV
jgi:hypothetical protein